MNPIPVSVIIPCFNVEEYIETCLNSVFQQTYKSLDIICVNDGSNDNTLRILEKAKKNSPFPFQIINQENSGAPAARNAGIKIAKGDYIQFLDADDVILPEKINRQIQLVYNSNSPSIVISPYKRIELNGSTQEICIEIVNDNIWLGLMKSKLGITSSNLWNKKMLIDVNGWNTSLKSSQEYDLLFRIFKKKLSYILDQSVNTITLRREHSISNTNVVDNWVRYIKLRTEVLSYVKNNSIKMFDFQEFHQIIFDCIRILFTYDSKKAVKFYKEFIPPSFKPNVSPTTSKRYLKLYKILGFRVAESFRKTLAHNKANH